MNGLQRVQRWLLGDYAFYRIVAIEPSAGMPSVTSTNDAAIHIERLINPNPLLDADDLSLRDLYGYSGTDSTIYVARKADTIVSACVFWHGRRYELQRNFWPLQPREAKLVEVRTDANHRGESIAPKLIRFAAEDMSCQGFDRLYARIWHSHQASLSAFAKAGWREVARVAEIEPLSFGKRFRWVRRLSSHSLDDQPQHARCPSC